MKCHCKDDLCFASVSFWPGSTLMTLQLVLAANCSTKCCALFKYHHYLLWKDCLTIEAVDCAALWLIWILILLNWPMISGTSCTFFWYCHTGAIDFFNMFLCLAGIKKYVVGLIIKTSSDASIVEVSFILIRLWIFWIMNIINESCKIVMTCF